MAGQLRIFSVGKAMCELSPPGSRVLSQVHEGLWEGVWVELLHCEMPGELYRYPLGCSGERQYNVSPGTLQPAVMCLGYMYRLAVCCGTKPLLSATTGGEKTFPDFSNQKSPKGRDN